ncbi:hypothetical protein GH5_02147 [Leishmania sp. Ghana 2012 LV757]|uniref:hypothetical protein n=1 Tax=Leishmania sp. Ghana 2012 LV757 TaxID=2803181 RepID=UPI001B4099EE|nr:hypothetical protein GH5_02147 [Leishmania sp. Ghana 2012 LV757]
MATKRLRSNADVWSGIDELLTLPVSSPPHGDEYTNAESSAGHSYPSPRVTRTDGMCPTAVKRLRTSESSAGVSSRSRSSASPSSPRTTSDSIGGDEIDRLQRRDEEVTDMALFLAKTVGETSSRHSLAELVAFLERLGISRVMSVVKRVGWLTTFVSNLHQATSFADDERRIVIELFAALMPHADAEALFQESFVTFLVQSLLPAAAREAPAALHHRSGSHWSARPTQKGATQQPSPSTSRGVADGLEAQVARLSGRTTETSGVCDAESCASLALRSLLTLMFLYNRSPHVTAQRHLSVPLLFARAGGLEQLGRLLTENTTREHALALIEVLTATDELSAQSVGILALVPALMAQLHTSAVQVPALRALTNISNIVPHALSASGTVAAFARFALQTFSRSQALGTPDEAEIFALCCAINVVKHESKETERAEAELASALVASRDTLESLALAMMNSYQCSSTEQLVRGGYYALLLGALSLVSLTEEGGTATLRVPVMTAVARASRGTSMGRTAEHQPMRIVVAIIQEFLLFQSTAGTLTVEALTEMKALVDRILCSNQIDVTPEGDHSGTAEKAATSASVDEDDDVVLGHFL